MPGGVELRRLRPDRGVPAPLDNREIAFGCGSCRAPAALGAPSALSPGIRRGCHGRAGASVRRSLRPRLPVRRKVCASSAHGRHAAWSGYLPAPPAAPWRRCAHPAARARSGPVPAACPLARCRHVSRFCGARSAHLMLSEECFFDLPHRTFPPPVFPLRLACASAGLKGRRHEAERARTPGRARRRACGCAKRRFFPSCA